MITGRQGPAFGKYEQGDSDGNGDSADALPQAVPVSMLGMGACGPEGEAILASPKATDIRIEALSPRTKTTSTARRSSSAAWRSTAPPCSTCTAPCEPRRGKVARGFGSMPLGNVWSFPSQAAELRRDAGGDEGAGRADRQDHRRATANSAIRSISTARWSRSTCKAAAEVSERLHLAEPIPKLCTLVAASPFDAALHDAFGKAHGLNCYHTYGPEFMTHDLGHYLGAEFNGRVPRASYMRGEPKPRMPLYHLVGALDPLERCGHQEAGSATACPRRWRSGSATTA